MISFSKFFEESEKSPVFAQKETLNIIGIGDVPAKIDTGNDKYCVLHGTNIKINGDKVTFDTVNDKTLTLKHYGMKNIKFGAGNSEDRPIVKLSFKLNGKSYKDIKFTIGDREKNEEKALVGLDFLIPRKAIVKVEKE